MAGTDDKTEYQEFIKQIKTAIHKYRFGAIVCCIMYYLTYIGPIFFGIMVASYVLFQKAHDIDTTLLLVTTLSATGLSSIGTLGDFKGKWHTNRDAVYSLWIIVNKCFIQEYRDQMKYINDYELVILQHQKSWRIST